MSELKPSALKPPVRWRLRFKRFAGGVFERLARVPLGVWAALGAALVMLELYLRGRRLDAALAQERLRHVAAEARATLARNAFREELHLERAARAREKIDAIKTARGLAAASGAKEEKRLSTLDSEKVHAEYMKLLLKKWEKVEIDAAFKVEPLGKITIRPRPPRKVEPPKSE